MSYAPVTEVDIDAIPVIDVGPVSDRPEGEIAWPSTDRRSPPDRVLPMFVNGVDPS